MTKLLCLKITNLTGLFIIKWQVVPACDSSIPQDCVRVYVLAHGEWGVGTRTECTYMGNFQPPSSAPTPPPPPPPPHRLCGIAAVPWRASPSSSCS
jgi:hypothetical protein